MLFVCFSRRQMGENEKRRKGAKELLQPQKPSISNWNLRFFACFQAGGRGRIRTFVGRRPADLQSALVGRLSILPLGEAIKERET